MSIVKQTLYIANPKKESELKKSLFVLVLNIKKFQGCINFEVYEADDCKNECLLYEEWSDEEAYNSYLSSKEYKEFLKRKDEIIKRVEIIPEF